MKKSKKEIKKLYIANKRTKNLGSITEITSKVIPDHDLLTYSFPCQDLSTGGKTRGMSKGSGTRSGLLWEIERILGELNNEGRLPKYLEEDWQRIRQEIELTDPAGNTIEIGDEHA